MSVENRSSSALFKRAEQLKRWEESETNREIINSKTKSKRIQFSLECVFLAACASGDKEEVLRLLNIGADIDTSNVDGLSALHQVLKYCLPFLFIDIVTTSSMVVFTTHSALSRKLDRMYFGFSSYHCT